MSLSSTFWAFVTAFASARTAGRGLVLEESKSDPRVLRNNWDQHAAALGLIGERAKVKRNPFVIPEPPRGVVAAERRATLSLAMDENIRGRYEDLSKLAMDDSLGQFYGGVTSSIFYNGYVFLGYALLSDMAQVAEFRKPCEILANEMTREWLTIKSRSDDLDLTDKISAINDELERLNAKEIFRKAFELDNMFGIGQIFLDTGEDSDALKTPLPTPDQKAATRAKLRKGSLKSIRCIEPIWNYPGNYNANNPLDEHFYRPQTWWALSTEIHSSRMLTMISRPVPDLLKPAYLFGGLSLMQMMQPYVDNWVRTRQAVSDIINNFATLTFGLDMSAILAPGGNIELIRRAEAWTLARTNMGVFLHDKDKEELGIVTKPLGSLDKLQAQAQEQMASVASIPLVKLLGITPSGLNASTDGEIRAFYDTIRSEQIRLGTPHFRRLLDIIQLSLFGDVDDGITFAWNPLWALDDKEKGDIRKQNADTDIAYIDAGVLSPEEVRAKLATEENSPYSAIDVENVPDLASEEEEGLEPEGGRPDDKAKDDITDKDGGDAKTDVDR